ncbi:hypothetical protein TrLO_g10112 [Triparma laevis f. longispina]|uniref:Geranylgeranyl transferase type-2 subunit beta n=1 Tax=Triparma laevis f. longispina TaxID=1714387 RepID=A0A9W7A607_9STRA|nr:hypothetical protein TrLO_g10112 [Triparma laevis f. longispina]
MASFLAPAPTSIVPPFSPSIHKSYILMLSQKLSSPTSYEGAVTSHLRMSGVYWSLASMHLMCEEEEANVLMNSGEITEWVLQCFDEETGGFAGNVNHDPHILYTLSALQILAMFDSLSLVNTEKVVAYITSLQNLDGSFSGDSYGEIDTRFSYCALSSLSILNSLSSIDLNAAANFISTCQNFDGGFGCNSGAESHAGQIFTCVAALSIAKRLDLIDVDLLSWWLAERQTGGGGLNGRPEKQSDVCYSWWILSSLEIIGRRSWVNGESLATFILKCQDTEKGGIADRPDNVADVFHTFFGISGLLLLGQLKEGYRQVDSVYALPVDVVERLGLNAQVIEMDEGATGKQEDKRLAGYERVKKTKR